MITVTHATYASTATKREGVYSIARLVLIATLLSSAAAYSAEGGMSNYLPGFYGDLALAVEPPKGLSIRNDAYFYSGDVDDAELSRVIISDAEVDLWYNYLTFLYNPDIELLGASLAFGLTSSVAYVDIDADVEVAGFTLRASDHTTGVGDVTLAANYYWNDDKWNYLWANYVVTPLGSYDADDLANTGLNYWTLETDFMVTYFDQDKGRDYSVILGYSYNTENDDTDYQSGDEFHLDFVLNQFLTESFALGINGFFYRQLSGDSGSGARLGNFRGQASGLGPAVYWNTRTSNTDVYFTFKWINEFDVKHRFDGDHLFASFAMSF